MADIENSKDLTSVLWSGADVLRSKMDANEYKNYLLGIVFYKYLSDSFLIKVYDLLYDEKPETLRVALDAYREALEDESAEELKEQLEEECHYVIEPDLTYTYFAEAAKNNSFNREQLQKAFNNIEQSDPTRMLEIIEQAKEEGRKVIVFSFYLDVIEKISSLLGNQCTEPINGSVTPVRRQEIIDEFDNAPAGKVLVSQIIAGGTGLNIQSASVVIFCEPQLKPSIENQATSRAYRMGQARNVLVYRLLCDNTIDERIMEMLAEKQAVFNAFADKSVAAENVEVDAKSLGNIIKEEIDRINRKRKEK